MSATSLVYVDLIKETPDTLDRFTEAHPGTDGELVESLYRKYLAGFQPYRVLIKSGDNEEPLFRSTERYFNRGDAVNAIRIGFDNHSNVYLREAEVGNQELRLAQDN